MRPISHTLFRQSIACLMCLFLSVPCMADDVEEEFARLRFEADSLHSIGKTDSAIILADKALGIARKDGNESWIVGSHSSLGVFLRSTGKIDEALAHYDQAMVIVTTEEFRRTADEDAREEVAALYLNLAALHFDMSHKEEAVRHAETAAEWAERCDDMEFRGQIYNAVGPIFTATGQAEKALQYQEKGYECAMETGDEGSALKAAAYSMLSCNRLGREKDVNKWRGICRGLMRKVSSTMARLTYMQAECSISIGHGDHRATIAWLDSILSLEGIGNLPFVELDCYNNLHMAYADLGQYDKAYRTVLESNALRDSLFEQGKAESLRELGVKYEAKEKELALAVSEAARARTGLWLAVALAVLAGSVAAFTVHTLRQRHLSIRREAELDNLYRNTERLLTTRYIEGLEAERARIARELHDGVSNDLAAIQMILQGENPQSRTLGLVDDCRDQVRRISYEMMPPEFAYATIDEVIRYYVDKLNTTTENTICTYESDFSETPWEGMPDDMALEIYRIVQEATGNAMRHSGARNISVCLYYSPSGIDLTVTDDGQPARHKTAGIGLRTMRQRAKASGGHISIDTTKEGTKVHFWKETPHQAHADNE